jgi:hypothetical protein
MYALSPASRELSHRESLTARFPSLSLGERCHAYGVTEREYSLMNIQ